MKKAKRIELPDLAGYEQRTCDHAVICLRQMGLIEKNAGSNFVTEKGKIVLALIIGKESRARAKRSIGTKRAVLQL